MTNWNYINSDTWKDKHIKRKSKFHQSFRDEFNVFERKNYKMKLPALVKAFNKRWFGIPHPPKGVTLTTAKRWIKENNISRKKGQRIHIRRCPVQETYHMRAVEHKRAIDLIDNDAMCTAPSTMEENYGRSPIGEVCEMPQFEIGGRTFSLFASVCTLGVLAYMIKEDAPINADDISS